VTTRAGSATSQRRSASSRLARWWGRVLHDTALAAALVDRLLHHGEVYYLKGDSYRLRGKPKTETPDPPETGPQGE
jgi:IstB-like ATP binding protein